MSLLNIQNDIFWEASKGKLPYEFIYVPFMCDNPPVGEWVTVWPGNVIYPYAIGGTVSYSSTSSQDGPFGTGIREIVIIGRIDGSNDLAIEFVTLNGTSPVSTVNAYNALVSQATKIGNSVGAVGTITGKIGTVAKDIIPITLTESQSGFGFTTNVDNGFVYEYSISCTKKAEFRFQRQASNPASDSPFINLDQFVLTPGTIYIKSFAKLPIKFGPNTNGQLPISIRSKFNR